MDSKNAWFDEIIREYMKSEGEIVQVMRSQSTFANWANGPAAAELLASRNHKEIVEGVRALVRYQMIVCFHTLMAGLDGATALADEGVHLRIQDQDGNEFGEHLASDFMAYLVGKGLA